MRIGNDQRIGVGFLSSGRTPRKLRFGGLAGIAKIVQHDRAERRLRPVAPAGVDRIVVDGDRLGAAASQALASRSAPSTVCSQGE